MSKREEDEDEANVLLGHSLLVSMSHAPSLPLSFFFIFFSFQLLLFGRNEGEGKLLVPLIEITCYVAKLLIGTWLMFPKVSQVLAPFTKKGITSIL